MKDHFKRLVGVLVVALMLQGFVPSAFAAEEDKVTGEVAVSVLSAYIWRGQELSRHSVVVQPSLTASYKGFTANVWGNMDTRPYAAGDEKYASNYTETDVTLSYSRKFGIVQAGAGYIYYGLAAAAPGGPDLPDSQEVFVTLGLDTILAPTLTVYKEIDHYHQWYALLGISHTFALHDKIGLKLAGSVSYLKSEDETTYPKFDSGSLATTDKFNNFHDATIAISLPVAVTKNLTITPMVVYVLPLSDDAKHEMRARGLQGAALPADKDASFLYGGIMASFTF
ncbi:MAG: TorF family putative porin [Smithellaceae bacterium]|nr:TorF family putative porin [Smithellaceae bacterium]